MSYVRNKLFDFMFYLRKMIAASQFYVYFLQMKIALYENM